MRKLLLATALLAAFALVAEDASARPRGARMSNPAPKPALATPHRRAVAVRPAKAKEDAAPPRHWKVALPRMPRSAKATEGDTQGAPEAAAPASGEAAAPVAKAGAPARAAVPAAPRTAPQPVAMSQTGKPARPAPVRQASSGPHPARKPAADGPKPPHKFAVCYVNQTGQCVAR